MSDPREINRLASDLLTWVRQNDTPEGRWFQALPGEPVMTVPETPAVSPSPTPPTAEADDPYAETCRAFVAETLELIKRQAEAEGPGRPTSQDGTDGDPATALTALRDEVLDCTACGLNQSRKHVVFGAGSPRAKVVIIGEAPGRDEDLQGEPFVGRSGQLLTKILGAVGLERQDVFICNILKCRPPENRDPLPPEVASCEPHLLRQLAILQPRVIWCLGRVAAQTLLQSQTSLGRLRKSVHFYRNIPVMVTYHPAYLLRNPSAKHDTWDDVRKLRALHDALAASETSSG